MTTIMRHKGYTAEVEADSEAGIVFGRVIDVRDVITFQGATVLEARLAFHDSVDDYLEFCAELGEEPDSLSERCSTARGCDAGTDSVGF